MKFFVEYKPDHTLFRAVPENESEKHGIRAQGPYADISLINRELKLGYAPINKLHPDIIAAICLTAFYPFIKYPASMPEPVSKYFARALGMRGLCQNGIIDGTYMGAQPITINNIDMNLKPYGENQDRTVIAFGGGMDSTATALMCPEFDIIHASPQRTGCGETGKLVREFAKNNLPNKCHVIDVNCDSLCQPRGFTTFTNIFLVPLIMSSDLGVKNICCGAVLGSTCLRSGNKFYNQFDTRKRNKWFKFYDEIGVHVFSLIAGCSELITSKIVYKNNLSSEVLFCQADDGRPCYKCAKCFRKVLELNYNGYPIQKSAWDNYEGRTISNFLRKRPLYFSHMFIETIKNNPDLPKDIRCCIKDIIDTETSFFNKIYSKSFVYFPREIKDILIERLTKYADVMSDEEERCLENWDMT